VTESLAKHNPKKNQINMGLPHLYAFCLTISIMFCIAEVILTGYSANFCNDSELYRCMMIC